MIDGMWLPKRLLGPQWALDNQGFREILLGWNQLALMVSFGMFCVSMKGTCSRSCSAG